MNQYKNTVLDTRMFRCGLYTWDVNLVRSIAIPSELPRINTLEEARAYFQQVKREYVVTDPNGQGILSFGTFEEAWPRYCQIVAGYRKQFVQLKIENGELVQAYDAPDPDRLEPN